MKIQMTREQKQMVRRLRAKGCSYRQIERDLGVSMGSVAVTLSGTQVRPGKIDEWSPAPGRLSAEEREDILVGLSRGESMSSIARQLGRAPRLSPERSQPTAESPTTGPGGRTVVLDRPFGDRRERSWTTLGS